VKSACSIVSLAYPAIMFQALSSHSYHSHMTNDTPQWAQHWRLMWLWNSKKVFV